VTEILVVDNLSKKFGNTQVLHNVTFTVNKGETVLLLGPNGAGKTTIIKCILGLLNYHGDIVVDGVDVRHRGSEVRGKIGYLPQLSSYYETLTVKQHSELMASLKGADKDQIAKILDESGLLNVQNNMLKELSSGMRQRFGLGIAMLGDPPLLILDEPTSNIDIDGQIDFRDMLLRLKKAGKAFLISTHQLGFDSLTDRVVILNRGRVVAQGKNEQIIKNVDIKDKIYLKVDDEQTKLVYDLASSSGYAVNDKNGWLSISLNPFEKVQFIDALIKSGVAIRDILIEQFSIESEYVKIIQDKMSNG
jgi:ABC-type multidrug transport system ATPase subunit